MDFIDESYFGIDEALTFIQESTDSNMRLRAEIIEPIMKTLDTKKGSDEYLKFGTEFIEANADMLAREFPTKRVSFPKKYVDNILMAVISKQSLQHRRILFMQSFCSIPT